MARIELTQLIAEMTPEQKIMCQDFYSKFDNRSAANRRIINVIPYAYTGNIAGTDLTTYAANIMYICLNLIASTNALGGTAVTGGMISFYDEANTQYFNGFNKNPMWDATAAAANIWYNNINISNIYFSRINDPATMYAKIKFIGYKVTLI